METQKPLQFNGTAGGYFVAALVTGIATYIPWFGWAFALNYMANWITDSTLVNGKKVVYRASYGESLKFVFVQSLLLIVTLGIYAFWFVPKTYRYVMDHIQEAGAVEAVPVAETAPAETVPTPAPEDPVAQPPASQTPAAS